MIAPDGTRFPWVLSGAYLWHRRTPDSDWYERVVGGTCPTLCGKTVRPLCITSGERPTPRFSTCSDCAPEATA